MHSIFQNRSPFLWNSFMRIMSPMPGVWLVQGPSPGNFRRRRCGRLVLAAVWCWLNCLFLMPYAVSCHLMPLFVLSHRLWLLGATTCHLMVSYAASCCLIPSYMFFLRPLFAVLCCLMLSCPVLCSFATSEVVLCRLFLCCTTLCCIKLPYAIWSRLILFYVVFCPPTLSGFVYFFWTSQYFLFGVDGGVVAFENT